MDKKILICLVAISFGAISCTSTTDTNQATHPDNVAKGNRVYGGSFRLSENESIQNLFPHHVIDAVTWRVATQIFEGLVCFDQGNITTPIPSIAESWSIDEAKTTYTFKLRKGVKFHNDACFPDGNGREVTANDFKYCFDMLCTKGANNYAFELTFKDKVLGANKYYEASAAGKPGFELEGIKVIDDYTLQITLEKPYSPFLFILSSPQAAVFPKEAYEKYNTELKVGTGAFKYHSYKENERMLLARNENYYKVDEFGNQLPYLDTIKIELIESKTKELDMFKKSELDMVYRLPTESIIEILETATGQGAQFNLQRNPEMSIQYYEFLCNSKTFSNKKIRQAFAYALDRKRIVEFVLSGECEGPGIHGITPPTFKGYDITQIKGYDLDVAKAKKLLAEAGYPNGKGFPKTVLEVNRSSRNEKVALEVQKQLKENLSVNIEISFGSLSEKIEKSKNGQMDFFRSGWIADFPSPENFLLLLYGKNVPADATKPSYPNTSRYVNPKFDELFDKALNSVDEAESFKFFIEAEQIAMDDAPVLVLWYEESYRLLQSKVKNFPNNAMQYRNLSEAYFSDTPVEAEKEEKKEEKSM